MIVSSVAVRRYFDSRGEPTIALDVVDDQQRRVSAAVPAGKSRGSREARVVNYDDARRSLATLLPVLQGRTFQTIQDIDAVILGIDTTADKAVLGGNLTLALSVALTRALALEQKQEAWQVMRQEFFPNVVERRPRIFSNVINGGAHAANNLAVQEYMLVASPAVSYAALTGELVALFRRLGDLLRIVGASTLLATGDEGGYCLNFPDNAAPLAVLERLCAETSDPGRFTLALDVAASSFYHNGAYEFEGKALSREQLLSRYEEFFTMAPHLMSLEDPFAEDDVEGFQALVTAHGDRMVVGDDLTVTHARSIEEFAERRAITGVIIKPNQVGTVSEACQALQVAQKLQLETIVSHRSGETADAFIIELARASAADGLKIGVPMKERISKFNEVIRLYDT